MPKEVAPEATGAGGGRCRRQERRMQGVQKEFQGEDIAKQRKDQELAKKRRKLQSEETAKAKVEWYEVARYVQLPSVKLVIFRDYGAWQRGPGYSWRNTEGGPHEPASGA